MNQSLKKEKNIQSTNDNEYCTCNCAPSMYSDTESSDFGYWDICTECNKKIENGFHYYNHYDGEDHDDIELEYYPVEE